MGGLRRLALMAGPGIAAAVLGGCGDGSGVQSTPAPVPSATPTPTPTPVPVPTPTPTPTPTPVATSYDTTEYRQTLGAVDMNALAAYQTGATGAGVTAAIIDSGIDATSAEFAGRLSAASQNVAGGSGVTDASGHGTAVAFTLAGARNGTVTQGVAFGATILALRADTPGTCATAAGGEATGCSFADASIAKGIDVAVTAGARVINMSLGGSAPSSVLVSAIDRATAAGIVIVIAAGNDGTANPGALAEIANTAVARGLVIVAGSVNAPAGYQNTNATAGTPDTISSFSDRAGDAAAHYLAAVGTRVVAPDQNGTTFLWTGTSFATPQIAAAVALLAQAFPTLTGAQIVSILYSSARDAGAAGVDAIYGNGILDLTRAFQPLGTSSVAGTRLIASTSGNGTLSAAMGDARGTLGTIILDSYARAFSVDLAQTLRHAAPLPSLAGTLATTTRTLSGAAGGMTLAVTVRPRADGSATLDRTTFSATDTQASLATAALVTQQLGPRARAAFAAGFGGAALVAALDGTAQPAFLVAGDPRALAGFDSRAGTAAALRRDLAGWGITAAAENGDVIERDAAPIAGAPKAHRWRYSRLELALDRRLGPLAIDLAGTRLGEDGTLLGARLGEALGAPHATSWFVDSALRLAAGGWSAGGSWRRGWTQAEAGLGLARAGTLRTSAYAVDVGKDGLFARGDSAGLRFAQPLRVSAGGLGYRLPTQWDYASGAVATWADERLNLAPAGRERDVEARYGRPLGAGRIDANLFWRREPSNIAAEPDDLGAAFRWSLGF